MASKIMKSETVQYDDHGNFLIEGDVEQQWMKVHREIQAEYRMEQFVSFLKGAAWVGVVVAAGYSMISAFNLLRY
jgi:phosphoribosylaminoimidazole carboxylase (NCAIR synthetase)